MLQKILVALLFAAPVPDFHLRDTLGAVHTRAEWKGSKAVLLFFVITDCPVGNSYVPEMNRIHEAYSARGVQVYAVQADPGVAAAEVAKYAREYGYTFPVLLDPGQALVKHTGATVTPEAAVLASDGKLLYLGRIDNRVEDFGETRPRATENDVRNALDAVLSGKPVAHATTRSIGCAIPGKMP